MNCMYIRKVKKKQTILSCPQYNINKETKRHKG